MFSSLEASEAPAALGFLPTETINKHQEQADPRLASLLRLEMLAQPLPAQPLPYPR